MSGLVYSYLLVAIVLDPAHLVSPIVLAWGNRSFRQVMGHEWGWYILLPLVLLALSFAIGLTAKTAGHPPPQAIFLPIFWADVWRHGYVPNGWYWGLIVFYFIWNAWHYGAQHFGIASLLGWRRGPRWLRQGLIIAPTMALMLGFIPLPVIGAITSLLHWTTDIGLSAWRMKAWWFLAAVLLFGLSGFLYQRVGDTWIVLPAIPVLISLRCGLGFVHFLYSRWVWKLSDPRIRGSLGIAL